MKGRKKQSGLRRGRERIFIIERKEGRRRPRIAGEEGCPSQSEKKTTGLACMGWKDDREKVRCGDEEEERRRGGRSHSDHLSREEKRELNIECALHKSQGNSSTCSQNERKTHSSREKERKGTLQNRGPRGIFRPVSQGRGEDLAGKPRGKRALLGLRK